MQIIISEPGCEETELHPGDQIFWRESTDKSRDLYFERDGDLLEIQINGDQRQNHVPCWLSEEVTAHLGQIPRNIADDICRVLIIWIIAAAGYRAHQLAQNRFEITFPR